MRRRLATGFQRSLSSMASLPADPICPSTGGLAGYAVAFIGTRIVAGVLKEKLGLVVEPVFDPQITFIVLVASIALAALAGLIPAAVAYRTSVARNLRPTD